MAHWKHLKDGWWTVGLFVLGLLVGATPIVWAAQSFDNFWVPLLSYPICLAIGAVGWRIGAAIDRNFKSKRED